MAQVIDSTKNEFVQGEYASVSVGSNGIINEEMGVTDNSITIKIGESFNEGKMINRIENLTPYTEILFIGVNTKKRKEYLVVSKGDIKTWVGNARDVLSDKKERAFTNSFRNLDSGFSEAVESLIGNYNKESLEIIEQFDCRVNILGENRPILAYVVGVMLENEGLYPSNTYEWLLDNEEYRPVLEQIEKDLKKLKSRQKTKEISKEVESLTAQMNETIEDAVSSITDLLDRGVEKVKQATIGIISEITCKQPEIIGEATEIIESPDKMISSVSLEKTGEQIETENNNEKYVNEPETNKYISIEELDQQDQQDSELSESMNTEDLGQYETVETTEYENEEPQKQNQGIIELEKEQFEYIKKYGNKVKEQPKKPVKAEFEKIGAGCIKCGFTGLIEDPITGIKAVCDCQYREKMRLEKEQNERVEFERRNIRLGITDQRMFELVIPEDRRESDFQEQKAKEHIGSMAVAQNVKIKNYQNYVTGIIELLNDIENDSLNQSYLIGSPSGFGKETAVYTAIKRLLSKGKKVVPYKSLAELGDIKVEYEKELLRQMRGVYSGSKEKSDFTWKDYLEADVLFTYLSSVASKELESEVLYGIINIRSKNGLPTVVTTTFPIEAYTSVPKLKQRYWDDMLAYKPVANGRKQFDRLYHISCFKLYDIVAKKGKDY